MEYNNIPLIFVSLKLITMPNWCDNYIIIYGEKENMAPIYKYFTESERVIQVIDTLREDILTSGTSTLDDVLRDYPYPDNLVMNSLCPRDEEYDRIVNENDFLLHPQSTFYGTKWDYSIEQANLHSITEEEIIIAPMTAWGPCDRFCQMLSKKYGVHPTQIGTWKRAAIENMATAFTRRGSAPEQVSAADVDKLHSKIGQLVVERDFLADAS